MKSISIHKLSFVILQIVAILFWGIPELFQKPFKVLILFFLAYMFLLLCYKKRIKQRAILAVLVYLLFLLFAGVYGGFQTSLLNMALSGLAIPCIPVLYSSFSWMEKKKLQKLCYVLCFLMFVQLLIFRSGDGRPNLGYELNFSAAFLFLFFLFSDYLEFQFGKFFVIISSLLLLSRLLILCILLFYIISIGKRFINRNIINWHTMQILTYTCFFIFNFWFLLNVERGEAYDTSINRVTSLNDGSNMLRFSINASIIANLATDENFKFGYGPISKGESHEYKENYMLMPHNELLDSIAEFGYLFTIISILFSSMFFKIVFSHKIYNYFIPILVYTLILWTRFLIIPSLEMFLVLSLFTLKMKEYENINVISK